MKFQHSLFPLLVAGLAFVAGCSSKPDLVLVRPAGTATYQGARDGAPGTVYDSYGRPMRMVYSQRSDGSVAARSTSYKTVTHQSGSPRRSPSALLGEVRVKRDGKQKDLKITVGER